jgi:hypothetical protein
MSDAQFIRRLAAILAADVVGYTRLMQANEERTLSALRQHRQQLFDPTVTKYGGSIFKTMGDGFLVEFGSILNAARCAVEIQRGMEERNSGVPEDRHIRFRIGINVGDIIVDAGDFFGDGVNLRHVWKVWLVRAVSPVLRRFATKSEANSKSSFWIRGRKTLRTLRIRSAFTLYPGVATVSEAVTPIRLQ